MYLHWQRVGGEENDNVVAILGRKLGQLVLYGLRERLTSPTQNVDGYHRTNLMGAFT